MLSFSNFQEDLSQDFIDTISDLSKNSEPVYQYYGLKDFIDANGEELAKRSPEQYAKFKGMIDRLGNEVTPIDHYKYYWDKQTIPMAAGHALAGAGLAYGTKKMMTPKLSDK